MSKSWIGKLTPQTTEAVKAPYAEFLTTLVSGILMFRLCFYREINLASSFLYASIAIIIVLYWGFDAYLRTQEKISKQLSADVDVKLRDLSNRISEEIQGHEQMQKDIETHNGKINALLLRAGLG